MKFRKLWAKFPLTLLQRCCICDKFGVKAGVHSYWGNGKQGKICWRCTIDMLTTLEIKTNENIG